jgi:serine/threonine protein kinase
VIQKEKRLTEDRVRIYITEVLLALEDLHKRDIIFRDLKPDNVVLDEDGHALLTDFGLSKEGVMDNISAQSFCGSVAYLAPEMLRRSGHGKSVDWYLLGVLMYELLVGMPPYFTNNRYLVFAQDRVATSSSRTSRPPPSSCRCTSPPKPKASS